MIDEFRGASAQTLHAVFEERGLDGWRVKVGERIYEFPSMTTLLRMKKMVKVGKRKAKPAITPENAASRALFANDHYFGNFQLLPPEHRQAYCKLLYSKYDVDESWIFCPSGNGEYWIVVPKNEHGEPDLDSLDEHERKFFDDHMKGKPHKFLIFAVTTTPTILNPTTCHRDGAIFHLVKNGIVYVERICSVREYKNGREPSYKDMMVNGPVFEQLMLRAANAAILYEIGEDYDKCSNVGIDINLSTEKLKEKEKKDLAAARLAQVGTGPSLGTKRVASREHIAPGEIKGKTIQVKLEGSTTTATVEFCNRRTFLLTKADNTPFKAYLYDDFSGELRREGVKTSLVKDKFTWCYVDAAGAAGAAEAAPMGETALIPPTVEPTEGGELLNIDVVRGVGFLTPTGLTIAGENSDSEGEEDDGSDCGEDEHATLTVTSTTITTSTTTTNSIDVQSQVSMFYAEQDKTFIGPRRHWCIFQQDSAGKYP